MADTGSHPASRRLFFAVTLSEEVRLAVTRTQTDLRRRLGAGANGWRWTPPDLFHYTLHFLGETPEGRLSAVVAAAQKVAAESGPPFPLTVAHIGALPDTRQPRILYACVNFLDDSFPKIRTLAESLHSALAEQGFAPETRPFWPHLTLARVRSPEGASAVKRLCQTRQPSAENPVKIGNFSPLLEVDKIGVVVVESFTLMESKLRPEGPVYTPIAAFPLGV